MKIINTTQKDGETHYHYNYSDIKEFLKRGFEHGDCGVILVKKKGMFNVYRGFGVIENPIKYILTMSIVDNPIFDTPSPQGSASTHFRIIDFSKLEQK